MLTVFSPIHRNVILWSHRILQLVLCFSELAKKRCQVFPALQVHFSPWSLHFQKCLPDPQCRASSAAAQGPGVGVAAPQLVVFPAFPHTGTCAHPGHTWARDRIAHAPSPDSVLPSHRQTHVQPEK